MKSAIQKGASMNDSIDKIRRLFEEDFASISGDGKLEIRAR